MPLRFTNVRRFLAGLGAILVLGLVPSSSLRLGAQDAKPVVPEKSGEAELRPVVVTADRVGVSKSMRDLKPLGPATGEPKAKNRRIIKNPIVKTPSDVAALMVPEPDGAVQSEAPVPAIPGPIFSFDGATVTDCGCAPPDTNGDVGPNHYVQQVNVRMRVYNKTTGALLAGPIQLSQLFASAGFTDRCATNDDGDPIVLYDQLADRWVISQFAVGATSSRECVAVSRTPDPTGSWYLYSFAQPPGLGGAQYFQDYPKLGVWPDAYYMTTNQFNLAGTAFLGAGAFAYERERMLRGDPGARIIYFDLNTTTFPEAVGGMLPADLDGYRPPPAGAPNPFVYFTAVNFGDPANGLRIFNFSANWSNPAASTFTEFGTTYAAPLPVAPFNVLTPSGRADVEQPGVASSSYLDAIADRLMHRLQYRNFGSHQTLVTNHTVNAGPGSDTTTFQAAIRWYDLRRTTGFWSVNDQGTFAAADASGDTTPQRWMGSAAMDASGNLAVGYSKSSLTVFPSLAYAGRRATDPSGQLAQGEAVLFGGLGSQSGTGSRWGDYSNLALDVDDCTYYFTSEYYPAGATSFNWRTRIGRFNFGPGTCTPPSLGTVNVNVTACSGGTAIQGAAVAANGVLYGATGTAGTASMRLVPGTYTVAASRPDLSVDTTTVTVTGGSTQTVNLCLSTSPIMEVTSSTLVAEGCAPANGAADPDETVTYALTLRNSGLAPTSNLVVTLQPGPNVVSPSAPQTYGVVNPGASATRNFTWTAAGVCGSPWTATFTLADPGSTLPNLTIGDTLGALVTTTALSQGFDGVTAPALPAGWTAANAIAGDGVLWATSTAGPDTAPNSAFINDPGVVSDKALVTPAITLPAAGAFRLEFRNKYALENTFDGGVLEASTNGGATWTDIVAAGGSFATGGYNATISSSFSSPIGGRQAWTGTTSGAYLDTAVNLPAAFAGLSVSFRFRMASDSSVAGTGWNVDTVRISSASRVCTTCSSSNLQVVTLKAPAAGAPGGNIAIKDTTGNVDAGAAPGSTTRFWLSANKTLGGDTLIGSRAVGPLAAFATSAGTTTVTLPAVAPGLYYLIAQADGTGAVPESNETDNTRLKAITIGPDLIISKLTFAPDPPARTGTVVTISSKNKGGQTTGVGTITRLYRSTDNKLDASDTLLGFLAVPVLGPNQTSTNSIALGTIPAGSYYFFAVADATNLVTEAKEGTPNQKKVLKTVP